MHEDQEQFSFADLGPKAGTCKCGRCGAACKVNPISGSKATMLKRSENSKGLCVNCAAHDWLRNTYPANLLLAQSGPRVLAFPHIQEQFAGLMKMANSDARPEEIYWDAIIANWDLPFPTKLRPRAENPVTQEELDRAKAAGEKERREGWKPPLTEQELKAKQRAEMDAAARSALTLLNPGFAGKRMSIREDLGSVTISVDSDNARE